MQAFRAENAWVEQSALFRWEAGQGAGVRAGRLLAVVCCLGKLAPRHRGGAVGAVQEERLCSDAELRGRQLTGRHAAGASLLDELLSGLGPVPLRTADALICLMPPDLALPTSLTRPQRAD